MKIVVHGAVALAKVARESNSNDVSPVVASR